MVNKGAACRAPTTYILRREDQWAALVVGWFNFLAEQDGGEVGSLGDIEPDKTATFIHVEEQVLAVGRPFEDVGGACGEPERRH
jgi:hypothetical protein